MRNPKTIVEGSKRCRHCDKVKPVDQFYRHSRTADRLGAWCRNCIRITRRMYREQRKERQQ